MGGLWAFRMVVPQENYVAIVYDPACACEPLTRPECRVGALRNNGTHVQMMVRGAISRFQADSQQSESVTEGDAVFLWDAKRHGNEAALMRSFTKSNGATMSKEKLTLYTVYDEQSMRARLGAVRGVATVHQTEFLHVVTSSRLSVPERNRKHYSGTTHGNVLGPVLLPTSEHSWQMTVGNKKRLYGAARPDPKDYEEENRLSASAAQRRASRARGLPFEATGAVRRAGPFLFNQGMD